MIIKNRKLLAIAKARNIPIVAAITGAKAVKACPTALIYVVINDDSTLSIYYFINWIYFFVPTDRLINDTTYPAITKARPIPTKENKGQSASPVSCTPVVTEASKSVGVTVPKKSMTLYRLVSKGPILKSMAK